MTNIFSISEEFAEIIKNNHDISQLCTYDDSKFETGYYLKSDIKFCFLIHKKDNIAVYYEIRDMLVVDSIIVDLNYYHGKEIFYETNHDLKLDNKLEKIPIVYNGKFNKTYKNRYQFENGKIVKTVYYPNRYEIYYSVL